MLKDGDGSNVSCFFFSQLRQDGENYRAIHEETTHSPFSQADIQSSLRGNG